VTTRPTQAVITLTNLMGQHVQDVFKGLLPEGSKNIWFDTSALPSGIYLLAITTPTGSEYRRLVVR
jgi:Secretion system C-terminal sorting domain